MSRGKVRGLRSRQAKERSNWPLLRWRSPSYKVKNHVITNVLGSYTSCIIYDRDGSRVVYENEEGEDK